GARSDGAFAAGYETACRVGRWLGDVHYRHGYHAAGVSQGAAALIQGTAAHWLDYDDVNLAITGHPDRGRVLGPAAAGAGARKHGARSDGAFAAGYETACRVGRWLGDVHYRHGYHA
ncbi:hypothetical protein CKW47_20525, partial [Bordetella pertussis]